MLPLWLLLLVAAAWLHEPCNALVCLTKVRLAALLRRLASLLRRLSFWCEP
jgi:hypothetical protein